MLSIQMALFLVGSPLCEGDCARSLKFAPPLGWLAKVFEQLTQSVCVNARPYLLNSESHWGLLSADRQFEYLLSSLHFGHLLQAAAPSLPTGPEPTATIEVEYPLSNDLQPVEEPAKGLEEAVSGMGNSDWQVAMPALVLLRRLTIHHSQEVWNWM